MRQMIQVLLAATTLTPLAAGVALAQGAAAADPVVEDGAIVVTARLRAESLQNVPDSIVAFGAKDIAAAGIDQIQDIADMVPNVILRKGFRSGESNITIRGITSGRQGWPPVAFVIDGVKATSIDAMEQGTLLDVERIEVLKGPQGALYGAGAIGGAINIVTRKPSQEFEGRVQASYARGNDIKLSGGVSGPIVDDTLFYSVSGYFNDTDGIVKTANGTGAVDARQQTTGRARLLFTPGETLSFDLRASITDSHGSVPGTVDKISNAALVDEFRTAANPGPMRRKGYLGRENRRLVDVSLRTEADLDFATFSTVLAYQDINQDLFGTVNYEGGPAPASRTLFGAETFGEAAAPGQVIDEFQDLTDDFETYSADIRLTSASDQRLRWVVGLELARRLSYTHLGAGQLIAGPTVSRTYLLNRWDRKLDKIWGVYAQASYDIVDGLELTVAGRYDEDNARNTRVTDPRTNTPIPAPDPDGNLVDSLKAKDSAFTPKVQLSYSWTSRIMTYLTYSEGYRFGFYNSGNRALPESTKNYEIGLKSQLFGDMLTFNAAAFRIDYSNQQVTQTIATPPFRTTTNIPNTKITGFEADLSLRATDKLQFSGGIGYTDAVVQDAARTQAPVTPKWTANASMQWQEPLSDTLDFVSRVDYRYQGGMFLRVNEVFPIKDKTFVDARIGVEHDRYSVKLFVENLLDTQQALSLSPFAGQFTRTFSPPRSYGVEVQYKF